MTEQVHEPQADEEQADETPGGMVAAPPTRRRHRWYWAAAGLVAVLGIIVAVSGASDKDVGLKRLAARDPDGAKACSQERDWLNGRLLDPDTGKNANQLLAGMSVADAAATSSTSAIRSAAGGDILAGDLGDSLRAYGYNGGPFRVANLEKMRDACVAAGVDMPDWSKHPS